MRTQTQTDKHDTITDKHDTITDKHDSITDKHDTIRDICARNYKDDVLISDFVTIAF